MTVRKLILAAVLLLFGATGAQADPILTPIIASYFAGTALAGGITIAGSVISYASIAPYDIKAPK